MTGISTPGCNQDHPGTSLLLRVSLFLFSRSGYYFYFNKNFYPSTMKELVYPKKLDVPSTMGNIFDLQEFFCSGRHTRAIARIEILKCKKLHFN